MQPADLDGDRDDGTSGELDLIASDIEGLRGGRGNDHLAGNVSANSLAGAGGDDIIAAGAGNDTVTGEAGLDVLRGGYGADLIRARDGGRDAVSCGGDADVAQVDGADRLEYGCETVER